MPKKKLLGREIRIRKDVVVKEHAARTGHNDPSAYGANFNVPFVEVGFGVGEEYAATLLMSKDAWNAFKKGAKLNFQ